jgi:hypothetical protein
MTRRIGRSCDFTRHDGFQPGVGFVLSSAQFSLVHILQPHCARFSAARESTYTIYPNEEEYMEITQLNLQPFIPSCLVWSVVHEECRGFILCTQQISPLTSTRRCHPPAKSMLFLLLSSISYFLSHAADLCTSMRHRPRKANGYSMYRKKKILHSSQMIQKDGHARPGRDQGSKGEG